MYSFFLFQGVIFTSSACVDHVGEPTDVSQAGGEPNAAMQARKKARRLTIARYSGDGEPLVDLPLPVVLFYEPRCRIRRNWMSTSSMLTYNEKIPSYICDCQNIESDLPCSTRLTRQDK